LDSILPFGREHITGSGTRSIILVDEVRVDEIKVDETPRAITG